MSIHPLVVLLLAMVVVLGGVLLLRLHAFLALMLGALLVALLTPAQRLRDQSLRDTARTIVSVRADGLVELRGPPPNDAENGPYAAFRYDRPSQALLELAAVRLRRVQPDSDEAIWVADVVGDEAIDGGTNKTLQQGDLLATRLQIVAAEDVSHASVGQRLAAGFGSTCGKIGLLIAMASIIGKCLLDSGAAEQIVATLRRLFGERLTPLALTASSFMVAIPVFFDTVFYLMLPLARALAGTKGCNYLLYVLAIVAGGSIAHSLVPPTPGPLFVASEFGVGIGMMIIGGGTVAAIGALAAYPYILWANRRWTIPVPEPENVELEDAKNLAETDAALPAFWLAILPILLPLLLIGSRTVLEAGDWAPAMLMSALHLLGDKNIALMLSAAISLVMLARSKQDSRDALRTAVGQSLSDAGVIILITASGGAFGSVLRTTGIAPALPELVPVSESGIAILLVAFGLTALIRVAQGSATVAMIASAGIIAPLAATIDLPYHPLYLALAVGSGSKPLPWMNDSGFWIVGRMSGMNASETLRTFTAVLTIMGFACLAATVAGAMLFPLV